MQQPYSQPTSQVQSSQSLDHAKHILSQVLGTMNPQTNSNPSTQANQPGGQRNNDVMPRQYQEYQQ
jgi:hypothetical protein